MLRIFFVLLLSFCTSFAALADSQPQVEFKTNHGNFTLILYPEKAPITVANFLKYVQDKHYHGTIFHRVIDGFMVQGGGFTAAMAEKSTRAPIELEARNGLSNDIGTIAMARTSDPNSATAQFFINVANNRNLNAPQPDGYGYAVFGKVIHGMDTIDKIRASATGDKGMFQNVPLRPILINSATLVQ